MISGRFVKILDFGLAHRGREFDESNLPTMVPQKTGAGTVMGTVGYVAGAGGGRSVDFRPISSLSTILTRWRRASARFQRPTAAQTMTAIIRKIRADRLDQC
jgi:hypothetical protein